MSTSASALLITAHPDDEAMFFTPTILSLINQGYIVHILCLSTGNADGLGSVRKQELRRACTILGIRKQNITIVDDPRLQDGMHTDWPVASIIPHIIAALDRIRPSKILTFDNHGVSGHVNHKATHKAVLKLCSNSNNSNGGVDIVVLWSLLRPFKFKLLWILCVCLYCTAVILLLMMSMSMSMSMSMRRGGWKWRKGKMEVCVNVWGAVVAWKAMKAHTSQFVWYRKVFVWLSSYSYINILEYVCER